MHSLREGEGEMKMAIIVSHAGAACLSECLLSWTNGYQETPVFVVDGRMGILPAFQSGLRMSVGCDILAYFHDDLKIHLPSTTAPNWIHRVLHQFEDAAVGLVGFGGATEHGTADLYKAPYDYRQLGRANYGSNVDDAEVHGARFTKERDVAVLDGYSLIVRREILERAGGWPLGTPIGYSLYDYWLCTEARRQGYRIRQVGIRCHHIGGQTAVKLKIADGQGQAHMDAHKWIYDHSRDVLPFRVGG